MTESTKRLVRKFFSGPKYKQLRADIFACKTTTEMVEVGVASLSGLNRARLAAMITNLPKDWNV